MDGRSMRDIWSTGRDDAQVYPLGSPQTNGICERLEAVARIPIILHAWITLPSCLASSSRPTLARMIFVSSQTAEAGRLALRHPDRSAPRLGCRCAVDQDTTVRLSLIFS
jgi:hypothetical protein